MSKSIHITVNEIFDLLRSGQCHEGVGLLYKYHYNKMFGVAFSIVKKESTSEDRVHNVIYKLLLLKTDKFPTSNELTWLYKVVRNEALMFIRNNKPVVSLDNITVEPIVEDKDIHDFVDMEAYYDMIKGLNEEQRQIVTLKVLGGYTHKEIAQMLDKPIGTIQWIYNTSVKKLKIALSSVMFAIVLSVVGFIERLANYVTQINAVPEIPGHTIHIPFDYSIIIFGVLFVILSIAFLLIFTKSHKIPTKADKRHI